MRPMRLIVELLSFILSVVSACPVCDEVDLMQRILVVADASSAGTNNVSLFSQGAYFSSNRLEVAQQMTRKMSSLLHMMDSALKNQSSAEKQFRLNEGLKKLQGYSDKRVVFFQSLLTDQSNYTNWKNQEYRKAWDAIVEEFNSDLQEKETEITQKEANNEECIDHFETARSVLKKVITDKKAEAAIDLQSKVTECESEALKKSLKSLLLDQEQVANTHQQCLEKLESNVLAGMERDTDRLKQLRNEIASLKTQFEQLKMDNTLPEDDKTKYAKSKKSELLSKLQLPLVETKFREDLGKWKQQTCVGQQCVEFFGPFLRYWEEIVKYLVKYGVNDEELVKQTKQQYRSEEKNLCDQAKTQGYQNAEKRKADLTSGEVKLATDCLEEVSEKMKPVEKQLMDTEEQLDAFEDRLAFLTREKFPPQPLDKNKMEGIGEELTQGPSPWETEIKPTLACSSDETGQQQLMALRAKTGTGTEVKATLQRILTETTIDVGNKMEELTPEAGNEIKSKIQELENNVYVRVKARYEEDVKVKMNETLKERLSAYTSIEKGVKRFLAPTASDAPTASVPEPSENTFEFERIDQTLEEFLEAAKQLGDRIYVTLDLKRKQLNRQARNIQKEENGNILEGRLAGTNQLEKLFECTRNAGIPAADGVFGLLNDIIDIRASCTDQSTPTVRRNCAKAVTSTLAGTVGLLMSLPSMPMTCFLQDCSSTNNFNDKMNPVILAGSGVSAMLNMMTAIGNIDSACIENEPATLAAAYPGKNNLLFWVLKPLLVANSAFDASIMASQFAEEFHYSICSSLAGLTGSFMDLLGSQYEMKANDATGPDKNDVSARWACAAGLNKMLGIVPAVIGAVCDAAACQAGENVAEAVLAKLNE